MDDATLLRRYLEHRSPDAFATIVDRYGPLVRQTARRHLRDAHLADDVAQCTFALLAAKAHRIGDDRSLAAWLMTTARFVALNQRKARARTRRRETALATMAGTATGGANEPVDDADDLSVHGPLIDDVLARLRPRERDVLVWRFAESASLETIGQRQHISAEAARKRVSRALHRARSLLRREGLGGQIGLRASLAALMPTSGQLVSEAVRASYVRAGTQELSPTTSLVGHGAMAMMTAHHAKILAGVAAAVLLAGGILAVAQPDAVPPPVPLSSPRAPATLPVAAQVAQPSAHFEDGTVATLAGVRHVPKGSIASPYWGGDGSAVYPPRHGVRLKSFHDSLSNFDGDGSRAIEVRIDIEGTHDGEPEYRARFGDRTGGATWEFQTPTGGILYAVFSLPAEQTSSEFAVGLARGPWEEFDTVTPADADARQRAAAVYPPLGYSPTTVPATQLSPTIRIRSLERADGKTQVGMIEGRYFNHEWKHAAWQLVVVTTAGRVVRPSKHEYPDGQILYTYDVPFDKVAYAAYRLRKVTWMPLGKVELYPTPPTSRATTTPAE